VLRALRILLSSEGLSEPSRSVSNVSKQSRMEVGALDVSLVSPFLI
jgi:hypothetical protein